MNGRTDICVGVKRVEPGHESCQQVIPLELLRAQILAVGKDEIYQNGGGICKHDEIHELSEAVRVIQKGIQQHAHQEYEPEQIGNQEELVKGDQPIQRAAHLMIMRHRVKTFHIQEKQAVHRPVEQQKQMAEAGASQLLQPEAPVVHHGNFLFFRPFVFQIFHCSCNCI